MPSLGADMESGTVVTWLVGVGDHVTRGQVVAEVDTEKSVIEVEAFVTGTVEKILVPEGERVLVGTPLAVIAETDDVERLPRGGPPLPELREESPPPPAPAEGAAPPALVEPAARNEPATAKSAAAHAPASPLARRKAAELGIDLALVTGTGPRGAVTAEDVERAVVARTGAPAAEAPTSIGAEGGRTAGPVAPLSGEDRRAAIRRTVAAAMARSKREIPHYYLSADVEMEKVVAWLAAHNEQVPVTARVLPTAVLLKATAVALRSVPDLNGTLTDGAFRRSEQVHLGVAVALRGGGLVAPAIHEADTLSLDHLMVTLRDLVARARAGRLRSSEMGDPTITVTILGDHAVDVVLPVIYPPQVAIVGFGRVRERPWVADGDIVARPMVTVTLAADHRVTDGRVGAEFLSAVERLLQNPEDLA